MKYFQILPKTNIDFIGIRKIFFVISGVIMLACLASLITKGLNYGLDFTGGTMVQVQFEEPMDIAKVRGALNAKGVNADIQSFVGRDAFAIKVKGRQENVNEVSKNIQEALATTKAPFEIIQTDFVGPTVGNHLAKKAILAFVLAMLAMVIYVAFRFQNIIWGAMGVAALFHDVFLTVGVFSFFQIEIDLVIVAAFLTIAGFSVNDTIVIFDRARENIRLNPKLDLKHLLNKSVNETLSRTIITSLTVIASAAILFIMGGDVLRNFSLALLIGLISGTYSTVALVPGLVYQWTKDGNYSAMTGVDAAPAKSGFEQPRKKNKKRHG
ncbi:MAG: protein translocase subunit SecF [Elusimicrobiota bacterium]|jgi:preprotein translocase subunit SecF|nr:protein translocase subunit SecF [Elusimicrobiota bacterium]